MDEPYGRTKHSRTLRDAVHDLSLRKVAASAIRAVLLLVGLLVALSTVGVDLTALSVLGGALGVGLGFGLQKLAANYVSGFVILFEPELHLGKQVLVPDIAGWRTTRLPRIPRKPYFTLAPDWVCEVASRSTHRIDQLRKLPIYAKAKVPQAWMVEPRDRSLEVLALHGKHWLRLGYYTDDMKIRAAPFEGLVLDLASLWTRLPSRASERTCQP